MSELNIEESVIPEIDIEQLMEEHKQELTIETVYGAIYPVGSIYMTTIDGLSPALLFGGTWEQIENRFLLGAGKFAPCQTGGEEQVFLNINQMPLHQHLNRNPIQSKIKTQAKDIDTDYQWEIAVSDWGAIETSYEGGNEAHNNMPPYFTVGIWQRIG